jgi:polar amino acid transport system substrate-binding protein
MKQRFLLVQFCFLFLSAFNAAISIAEPNQAQHIKVGVLHFPPYYVLSPNKPVTGIYADLSRKVLEEAGFSYSITGYPPTRFYEQLGDGTTDMFIGIKGAKAIEGKVTYSETILNGLELRAYSWPGSMLASKKEDLLGKKVIIIRGFGYGGLIKYLKSPKTDIDLIETNYHENSFRMLQAGRGDYLLNYKEPAEEVATKLPIDNLVFGTIYHLPAYFILNNNTINRDQVMKRLEDAFKRLTKSGAIPDYRNTKLNN